MVISPEDSGIKEEIHKENNIIISNSVLPKLIRPQLKKMSARHKVMCGYNCYIYAKTVHYSLLLWRDIYLKN